MAKKAIKIYLAEEDISWANDYPVRDTVGGTASFYVDWAFKQIRRGQASALQKLNGDEKRAILAWAHNLTLPQADYPPVLFAMSVSEWLSFEAGSKLGWSQEKIQSLAKICGEMTPPEVIGLYCWAKDKRNS